AKASTVCASLLDHITSITSRSYAHTNKQYEFACVTSFFTKFLMNFWLYQIKVLYFLKHFNLIFHTDEDIGGSGWT
ncbi:hypothetical protein, partial [Legionella moravica]|uniref:hypothetical protein n=1 Tax=Legionella moravica TaxID=39962 RepID=UPI001EE6D646